MKRAQKNLLLAAVLLAGGGGAAVAAWRANIKEREQNTIGAKRLFKIKPDDVTEGVIYARGATIAFSRDPVTPWRLTRPVNTPADATAIDAAVDRFALLPVARVDVGSEVTPEILRRYELERPRLAMEVVAAGAKYRLVVGPKNQMDGGYFVTDQDAKAIYLADPAFHWALDRDLEGFREPRIFPFPESEVVAIRVGIPSELKYALVRTPEGWTLGDAAGKTQSADEGAATLLLVALVKRLKAVHFLSDDFKEADAAQWGLEPFGYFVELEMKSGAKHKALFGAYRESAARVLPVAHPVGSTSVFEVPDWLAQDVMKSTDQLRDRSLSRFDLDDARRIDLRIGSGAPIRLEKNGATWDVLEGEKRRPAISYKVEPILRVLSRFRADAIDTADDLRAKGLDAPRWAITVFDAKGKKLSAIRVGAKIDEEDLWVMSEEPVRVGKYKKRLEAVLPRTAQDI